MAIPVLQRHGPKLGPKLRKAPWLNLLVTVALGILVAQATAQLLSSVGEASERRAPVPPAGISDGSTTDAGGLTPQSMRQMHLFGRASATGPEGRQHMTAPETPLDLVLKGVFYRPDAARTIALIGEGSRNVAQYRPGEELTGGGEIKAIYKDRVILRREGRLETLSLSRERVPTDQRALRGFRTGVGIANGIPEALREAAPAAGAEGPGGNRPQRTLPMRDELAGRSRLADQGAEE